MAEKTDVLAASRKDSVGYFQTFSEAEETDAPAARRKDSVGYLQSFSMAEKTDALAAPRKDPVRFRLSKSRSYLGNKIASSREMDEIHEVLNYRLSCLLDLEKDEQCKVEREKQKYTPFIYDSWTSRIAKIAAEVFCLNKKYAEVKKQKFHIWKRSSLRTEMATKLKEVVELSNLLSGDSEPFFSRKMATKLKEIKLSNQLPEDLKPFSSEKMTTRKLRKLIDLSNQLPEYLNLKSSSNEKMTTKLRELIEVSNQLPQDLKPFFSEKIARKLKEVTGLSNQLPEDLKPFSQLGIEDREMYTDDTLRNWIDQHFLGDVSATSKYRNMRNRALTISSSTGRFTIRKQISYEARDTDEFALEIRESKHQQPLVLEKILKHECLRLVRIRDFLSLILMYPMIMPDQHLLEKWRDDAQALNDKYFEDTDFVKVSGAYRWMHLLSEKPLKNMEVLIPNDILSKIEDGQRSMFSENAATLSREAVAFASTSKGKKVLEMHDVHNAIPEAILNLAADLAVNQLIQTLLIRNIHHVMFSTRNGSEEMDVMRRIEVALNDEYNGTRIRNKYSRVLWVDASKYSSNIEVQIRQEIAQQLGLMTSKGGQTEDNDILLTRLLEVEMTRMNHLVFLVNGDGEGKVDPWKVGFPKKMFAGVVVLITIESLVREHDELLMAMDLEIRTEDHLIPWELFCRNVGRELIFSSSDIQRIAVQIVEECRDHLLAIVIVAKSLKNMEDVELWEIALKKLRANRIRDSMNKVTVNAFINIIWNHLNEIEKLCVACSLYILGPKDKMADHLIISSWVYNKLVSSREEAEHILRDLVHRSILLKLEGKYILWSGEIFDVLKSSLLLYPSEIIKKGGLGLTELQITGEWYWARHIELMDNKLSELPLTMYCPKLTQLFLQGNANLMEIPPLFFHFMPHLHVLDLSCTSIRSLPSSLFNLKVLKELYLKGCKRLTELPPEIGKLENLDILDLDSTPITYIPREIQEMTKLKKLILSISSCHDGKKSQLYPIPPGVISKLTQLLYLSIDAYPDIKHWDESIEVILHDISELQKLITLNLYIPQVELLKHVPQCSDFRFVVGYHIHPRIISRVPPALESKFKQTSCSLRFINGVAISNDIFEAMQRSKALFLERDRSIKNLSQIDKGNLAHLRSFILGECSEMQTLIDRGCSFSPDLHWRFLCLYCMNNLRSICEVKAYFYSLKIIELHNCPKLTSIFKLNFLESLGNLEELIVEDCPRVSTLVSLESSESKEGIYLPRLRKVSLLYLPELVNISGGLCIGASLERIGFYDCPKLQVLSAMELLSQNLRVIKGEKEWWDALKWEEAEWGKGRLEYLHRVFSPIIEEIDIFDQFLDVEESSRSNNSWVENLDEEADMFSTDNIEKDYDESSRSNTKETLADIMSLSGVDADIDDTPDTITTGEIVGEPLPPSSDKVFKDGRQTWNRRKDVTRWTVESWSSEDGFCWIKYRRTSTPVAKFPREYFRCTHKYDRGCQAIKRVQRFQEMPPLYSITYVGSHTCGQGLNPEDSTQNTPAAELLKAVVKIQTVFRAYLVRKRVNAVLHCMEMQGLYRTHTGLLPQQGR